MQVTVHEVIHKRQRELLARHQQVSGELAEIKERELMLTQELAEINIEYQLLEEAGDRGRVLTGREVLTPSPMGHAGRKGSGDRLQFEDAVKAMFDGVGRPMSVKEMISQLERFGWQWSSYMSAYGYITGCDLVENAGRRGYYQLHRARW